MIYYQSAIFPPSDNPDLVEFKNSMTRAILLSGKSKKQVSIELGVGQDTLSHWISERTVFSMPGHMIPLFNTVVGNNLLSMCVCGRCEVSA